MRTKRILVILLLVFFLTACVNVNNLSYDDIINKFSEKGKKPNVFRSGFSFYLPIGLSIKDAGTNYVILDSENSYYYLYFDLVSFNSGKVIGHEFKDNSIYAKNIESDSINGYVDIKLWENNQYLIEINYNYAKIEVMVDDKEVNKALVNAISILDSIKYDKDVIEKLLKDDNLNYTEEAFNIFKKVKNKSNILDYVEGDIVEEKDDIKDTDFIN